MPRPRAGRRRAALRGATGLPRDARRLPASFVSTVPLVREIAARQGSRYALRGPSVAAGVAADDSAQRLEHEPAQPIRSAAVPRPRGTRSPRLARDDAVRSAAPVRVRTARDLRFPGLRTALAEVVDRNAAGVAPPTAADWPATAAPDADPVAARARAANLGLIFSGVTGRRIRAVDGPYGPRARHGCTEPQGTAQGLPQRHGRPQRHRP